MCRCTACKFGYGVADIQGNEWMLCLATEEYFEMEVAENNDLGCDLYVEKLDDNKTKKP